MKDLPTKAMAIYVKDDDGTWGIPAVAGTSGRMMPLIHTDITESGFDADAMFKKMAANMGKPARIVYFKFDRFEDVVT